MVSQPRSTTGSPPVIVFGDNQGDTVRSDAVLTLFASAGLALVDVEVRFWSSDRGCKGYAGLHSYTQDSHVVSICAAGSQMRTRTLVHELAHVWVAQNVDEAARTDFLNQRGLRSWSGPAKWRDRGTEHAAEIVAWGVSDHPCWVRPATTPIRNESLDTLTAAFRLLTGLAPQCDADAPRPSPKPAQEIP